jgi:hypothetical protein
MAVWPIEATPIPNPAIPCSDSGVLKTRSRPGKRIESLEIQMLDRIAYQTLLPSPAKSEEASQYEVSEKGRTTDHGTPEHSTECDILAKDDS